MKSMRLDVPFYPSRPTPSNPEGIHCVENSLQMILGFFEPDKKYSLEEMESITGKQPEKATWEMSWSIWFVDHGFEVKHYSTFDYEAFQSKGAEYIREAYGDETANWQEENSDVEEAKQLTEEYLTKIELISKRPTIEDINGAIENGYLIKVCVNQKLLNGQEGYTGHSVVITDLDDNNIWYHDPGLPAYENIKISKVLFREAIDSFGGEMDLIKKNN